MRVRGIVGLIMVVAGLAAIVNGRTSRQSYGSRYSSPSADVNATIAGDHIRIEYYAPSAHGRRIVGGLVPFGEVWATGANWATKITTEAALKIGDVTLPKGSYSIWTIPTAKDWTLIINKETGQFHLDYDSSEDLGRTKLAVKALDDFVETFRIELRPSETANQGTMALLWEKTEASVSFTVEK